MWREKRIKSGGAVTVFIIIIVNVLLTWYIYTANIL